LENVLIFRKYFVGSFSWLLGNFIQEFDEMLEFFQKRGCLAVLMI
jgi:hypothetical protein